MAENVDPGDGGPNENVDPGAGGPDENVQGRRGNRYDADDFIRLDGSHSHYDNIFIQTVDQLQQWYEREADHKGFAQKLHRSKIAISRKEDV